MGTIYAFAHQHWIVGGIVASVMWFTAGKQSLRQYSGKPSLS